MSEGTTIATKGNRNDIELYRSFAKIIGKIWHDLFKAMEAANNKRKGRSLSFP